MPSSDGGDDFVGVCGPCEGLRYGFGLGEEAVDGGLEVDDGAEDAAFQTALGQPISIIRLRRSGTRSVSAG